MFNNKCALFWGKTMANDFTKFNVDTKQQHCSFHGYRVLFLDELVYYLFI